MTAKEVLRELEPLGSEPYKKIIFKHGVKEPCFGVKVGDLKKIQKRIKRDHELALELYATGNYDAMYLAGLIVDDARMTKGDLERWVQGANCPTLSEYTVPWVAAEGRNGLELAREWIESEAELVVAAGWATFGSLVALRPDAELDLAELDRLLRRVGETIHRQPNRVRYVMNGFVIAVGSYVPALTGRALETAAKIGPVSVDMGGTACLVPAAAEYIAKVRERGAIGKKRKTVKC